MAAKKLPIGCKSSNRICNFLRQQAFFIGWNKHWCTLYGKSVHKVKEPCKKEDNEKL